MANATKTSKTTKPVAKKAVAIKAVKPTAKKSAATSRAKKKNLIKYEDKSKGQPKELTEIFENIRGLLLPYVKGVMKMHSETGGQAILINHKPVEIDGRKKPEMWFAAAIIQKGYVGFYFMPVYGTDKVKDFIKPELFTCLKGKACFHIKKADPVIYKQIKESLKLGYDAYKKRGWM